MKSLSFKTVFVALFAVSMLLVSACGKKTDESSGAAEVVIPDSPDAAVQAILTEFSKGNGGIAWEALPASYQSDINEVVHLLGASTDEEVYNKSFSLFSRLTKLVDQRKSFIVNSSLMENRSPEDLAQLEAALPSVVGLLEAISSSKLSSIEGLQSFSGQSFFETTVSECIEHVEAIGELAGEKTGLSNYASTVVSVVSEDENQTVLSIAVPGQESEEVAFTRVENRWVPVEMESDWQESIKKITDSIKKMPAEDFEAQKNQILGAITMVEGILLNIESAETQEQFDQSLRNSAMPLMGTFMMLNQSINSPE